MKLFLATLILSLIALVPAQARDDGHYANDPLKYWFDHLTSGKGMCCSFADGDGIACSPSLTAVPRIRSTKR
jgi:hypothetical protein